MSDVPLGARCSRIGVRDISRFVHELGVDPLGSDPAGQRPGLGGLVGLPGGIGIRVLFRKRIDASPLPPVSVAERFSVTAVVLVA